MAARSDGSCYNCRDRLSSPYWECDCCFRLYCGTYCIQEQYYDHTLACEGLLKQKIKESNQKTKVVPCRFFLAGSCKNGNSCEFLHSGQKVCEYFLAGTCKFGKGCVNLHQVAYSAKVKDAKKDTAKQTKEKVKAKDAPVPVCTHFLKGKCEYGKGCFKKHENPEAAKQPKTKQLLSDLVLNTPPKKPKSPTKVTKVKPVYKEEEKENVKYVKICEFYNRGNCAYGDKCTKAHEKLPLYKKDLKPEMMLVKKTIPKKPEPQVKKTVPTKVEQAPMNHPNFADLEDEIFISDSECSDYDGNQQSFTSSYTYDSQYSHSPTSSPSFHNTSLYGNHQNVVESRIYENNNCLKQKNLHYQEYELNESPSPVTSEGDKPATKNKPNTKKKELVNLYEVLQNSDESAAESDNESDLKKIIEPDENLKRPAIIEEVKSGEIETKPSGKEAKKMKKELKKKEKETNLRIIVDNLRYEGNNQFEDGNYKKAIALYTTAISKSGHNNPVLLDSRAAAFLKDGQYRLAYNDAKKSLDLAKNKKTVLCYLKCCVVLGYNFEGREKIKASDISKKAKQEYEEKFKKIENYRMEIFKHMENENYAKAATIITKARDSICSKAADFLLMDAVVQALQGNIKKAESMLEELDLKDQNAKCSDYYYLQGILYYNKNELVRSLSGFSEVKEVIPKAKIWHEKVSGMHSNLQHGLRMIKSKSYDEAIGYLSVALDHGADNQTFKLQIYIERGKAYSKLGAHSLALKDLTLALSIDDKDSKLWALRGDTYRTLGELSNCLEDYKKADKLAPNSKLWRKIEDVEKELKKQNIQSGSFYSILGVSNNVDQKTLKQEFFKKARMFHPDKHSNASEKERKAMENKMKDISRAYSVLSDPAKRREYDAKLEASMWETDDEYDSDDDFGFTVEEFFAFVRMYHQTGGMPFWGNW